MNFEKAYDSINWDCLDYMLNRMRFNGKWRIWIKECMQSETVSVLVNGRPTSEFHVSKGIRHGDPIAQFLFLIVADGMNDLIRSVVEKDKYKDYTIIGREEVASISHIQYADVYFECKGSKKHPQELSVGGWTKGELPQKFPSGYQGETIQS